MRRSLPTVALTVMVSLHPPAARPQSADAPLSPGVVTRAVAAVQNPQQTYALYLPKRYSPESRWPVVYIFDPLARGQLALQPFEHAAELHGFILAASNNSRNGPWSPQFEAAQAMVNDTQKRFSVDTRRIYFAGFSGGARVSSQLALLCHCAAGVLLDGAGFEPAANGNFPVFAAVGNADFNYGEIIRMQEQLEKFAFPHWLRVFEGPHEWAPESVMDEALMWFRLQAMKSRLAPRADELIAAQLEAASLRAESLERSGDRLRAYREYRQIAETFDFLAKGKAAREKAETLEKEKAFRNARKQEQDSFSEQERLTLEVLSAVSATPSNPADPASRPAQSAQQLARDLRRRSDSESRPGRALILKRAQGGVFIGSMESGNAALEKKDYPLAAQYFGCAAEANPLSEWVARELAVARALSGDRKGALAALRSAQKLTSDRDAFSKWAREEPALAPLQLDGGRIF